MPTLELAPRRTTVVGLRAVEARVNDILDDESARWRVVDGALAELPQLLADHLSSGGKRLRPSFLLAGVLAAGGDPTRADVIDVGAALELLHAFALIHDDVMDGSATRRGAPTMHLRLQAMHQRRRGVGEPRRFGEGVAVLAGDLALVYADRLMPQASGVRAVWDELRVELTMGQYLDVRSSGLGQCDTARAERITSMKSGRYTVVRPLHLAAELTARHDLVEPFRAFGEPLGRAFQLRDDVLGAFGSAQVTGKPVGDDLRQAKPTLLLEVARSRACGADATVLDTVGDVNLDEQGVERIREVLVRCGALDHVEREITRAAATAMCHLQAIELTAAGYAELERLARVVIDRDR